MMIRLVCPRSSEAEPCSHGSRELGLRRRRPDRSLAPTRQGVPARSASAAASVHGQHARASHLARQERRRAVFRE